MHIVICACCHVLCYISASSSPPTTFLGSSPCNAMHTKLHYITYKLEAREEGNEGEATHSVAIVEERRMETGTVRLFLPKGSTGIL